MSNPPTENWVGLSDRGLIDTSGKQNQILTRGIFVIEMNLPLADGTVILNHQNHHGVPCSFAIFYDTQSGISILHRAAHQVARHTIIGPLPQINGTARLTFRFDCAANQWDMRYEMLGHADSMITARGTGPLPMAMPDLGSVCSNAQRDAAVLWFGFSQGGTLPASAPWIGQRTMIETSLGYVAAGNLRAGDIIMTADQGPIALRALRRFDLPARGSFAPILLRAPFYGEKQDVLVSADQLLMISGGEVEYLFAADAVLIAAKRLVDGRTAIADDRRSVTSAVALDLGCAALIETGGLVLTVGQEFGFDDDLPQLNGFEVITLMSMLGRAVSRAA